MFTGGSHASSSDGGDGENGGAGSSSGNSFETPRASGRGTAAALEALDEEDGGLQPPQGALQRCWRAPAARNGAGKAVGSAGGGRRSTPSWFSLQWAKFQLMKVGGAGAAAAAAATAGHTLSCLLGVFTLPRHAL